MEVTKKDLILSMVKENRTHKEMMKNVPCSRAYLFKVLRENGMLKRDRVFKKRENEILELYEKYGCITAVANEMGLEYNDVYYYIAKEYE